MLIMPILNTNKNGDTKIYNVEVKLKNASKVRENTLVNGIVDSNVVVGNSSFNDSIYNTKNKENNVIVNFIRNHHYRDKNRFLVTTRKHSDNNYYDLYSVEMPPKKVTTGLDNLYGQAILDMQKEIPNIKKGRYISLEKLGSVDHISDERLKKLKYVVENSADESNLEHLLLANNLGDLSSTLEFIRLFDFTILDEATISEKQIVDLLKSFDIISTRDSKSLERYYKIAIENKNAYKKLSVLSRILTSKPINLIQRNHNNKVLIKTQDKSSGNME
ncbi:MAG: hypothetical protein Q4E39_02805 [bacterium]|nr:hypothetical protein [bacterium]